MLYPAISDPAELLEWLQIVWYTARLPYAIDVLSDEVIPLLLNFSVYNCHSCPPWYLNLSRFFSSHHAHIPESYILDSFPSDPDFRVFLPLLSPPGIYASVYVCVVRVQLPFLLLFSPHHRNKTSLTLAHSDWSKKDRLELIYKQIKLTWLFGRPD